jgi:iron(III) transport system permease protein
VNWLLLKNSLFVGTLATALAVSFGLVSAMVLAGAQRRVRGFLLALAVFALALPPFLVTNCWLDLLGYTGIWRSWLPLNIFSLGGAVWILALLLWPLTFFAVSSAWRRLEPAQLESDPAVSGWPLIRHLLFPLARSAIVQAAVLTFVLALNNFAVPAILQVKVFPAEMWVRFNTTFDTPGTLRLSWLLVLAPMLLLLWFYRRQIPWPSMERPVPPELFRRQLGKPWFIACLLGTAGICLLSVGLPLFELASVRRTWTELPGAWLAGQSAVWNSFVLPTLSATVVLLVSLLAISAFRSRLFGSLLWFSFLVPGVLLGMALIALFNHACSSAFYQSIGIVVLAFAVRYLALGWNTLAHASDAVDRQLHNAARLEGANFRQMLRWVYWPQIASQILAA